MKSARVVAMIALLASSTAAIAQSDVVVMRRVLAPPTRPVPPVVDPTSPADPGYYNWQVSAWQESGACGQQGVETRTVACVQFQGGTVPDSDCTGNGSGTKPVTSLPVFITDTCSYSWTESAWSSPTTTCGTSTITRDVSCVRSDQTVGNPSQCPQPAPSSQQPDIETSGCGYVWSAGDWSAPQPSCGDAIEMRTVACMRTDGAQADASKCTDGKPTTSQHIELTCDGTSGGGTTNPAVDWVVGAWSNAIPACGNTNENRAVSCENNDGTVYADSLCTKAKPATSQTATDYSTCTDGRTATSPYGWTVGNFGVPSTTCGNATLTRSVICTDNSGAAVQDSSCTLAKPSTTSTVAETSGCTYAWQTGAFGAVRSACGASESTRAVTCTRSDGTAVADTGCAGQTEPATTQLGTDYSACTFGWTAGAYSDPSTLCGNATQTRVVTCQRADGAIVDDSQCSSTKPDATQNSYQTSGCGLSWKTGDWTIVQACGATTETRPVTCLRSDGQTVDDTQCAPIGDKPAMSQAINDYSTCTFSWSVGAYPAPSSNCGTTTQTRSVSCQRSDGTTVTNDQCSGQGSKPDANETTTQTSSCSYSWSPEAYGTATPACGASSHYRTVDCLRSDGTNVDASFCSGAGTEPVISEATTDYSTCSYKWIATAWSGAAGCGATVTQTRNVTCQRSDATDVTSANVQNGYAYCSQASMIPSSQPITDYSNCTYSWTSTPGAWSGTCSSTATRPETVTCLRQDGATVDNSSCNASTRPPAQDTGNYSGCTYAGTYGAYGNCVANAGQTTGTQSATITACKRSDGTDVTSANASSGYTECSQTKQQSCTPTYSCGTFTTNMWATGLSGATNYTLTTTSSQATATAECAAEAQKLGQPGLCLWYNTTGYQTYYDVNDTAKAAGANHNVATCSAH